MRIDIDHREQATELAKLLEKNFQTQFRTLPAGDYRLEDGFLVERKTARDFVLSIIDSRLFSQIARLKQHAGGSLLLIEGNPYRSEIKMDVRAIRGALLSVAACWQMPVVFCRSLEETAETLLVMATQRNQLNEVVVPRGGYRPKRLKKRQLYVLQGLPDVGPRIAARLLERFRTVERVMTASVAELMEVEGVGGVRAGKIRALLESEVRK